MICRILIVFCLLCSPCLGTLRADINHDGIVNFGDFAILASEWMETDIATKYCYSSGGSRVVRITHDDKLNVSSGNWTYAIWAKMETLYKTDNQDLIYKWNVGPGGGIEVYVAPDSDYLMVQLLDSAHVELAHPSLDMSAWTYEDWDMWHHYAFVREGNIVKIYIDGIQQTVLDSDISNIGSIDNTGHLNLCGFGYSGYATVDDFRLYKAALTTAQIQFIVAGMNGRKGADTDFADFSADGGYINLEEGTGTSTIMRFRSGGEWSDLPGTVNSFGWAVGGVPFDGGSNSMEDILSELWTW
jgi:hypothetical protein